MKPALVVANWKMNGTQTEAFALARQIVAGVAADPKEVEVVIAPAYTALNKVREAVAGTDIGLAGQNAHWQDSGAFTGEISPAMLRDAGCCYVLLGHSERRHIFQESDRIIAKKIAACLAAELKPILCVGETWNERRTRRTNRVISRQLRAALKGVGKSAIRKITIAYEPVWAIGTGRNATPEQISEAHRRIRDCFAAAFGGPSDVRILYGGSVKPDNAAQLAETPDVDGLLVGGASLKAETFIPIIRCFSGG